MGKRFHIPEQAVAEVVAAWLEALGADVYQEVTVPGGVADIVARVGAELWIVEVKTSLSLALLVQAMERRRLAHRLVEHVQRNPGVTLKEAITHVEHHYASAAGARSSLAKWIEKGVVAGVRIVNENGRAVLMPVENPGAPRASED